MDKSAQGVLKITGKGAGVLRSSENSFVASPNDVHVPANLIKENNLANGALVAGSVRQGKRGPVLAQVETVGGLSLDEFQVRTPFRALIAIDPFERFRLSVTGEVSMRIVELIAPIGKGTRGLIVAPPKAGKTLLLAQLAAAIHAANPDTRIIVLLVDERPEEVTHFRRTVEAEVLASSNDQSLGEHIELAEMTLAHVRCELECGRDVVVLVDSLTRMARASNLQGVGARRTMSGGVDAAALEMPRRFFGLARKIEDGGSVTVIATALIGTGSVMDDLIFEEFKSTGNSEIVLDRELAEARIFPAINLLASGTRKEEQLYTEDEVERIATLRRWLAGGSPKAAMNGLLKLMDQVPTNEELLERLKS